MHPSLMVTAGLTGLLYTHFILQCFPKLVSFCVAILVLLQVGLITGEWEGERREEGGGKNGEGRREGGNKEGEKERGTEGRGGGRKKGREGGGREQGGGGWATRSSPLI